MATTAMSNSSDPTCAAILAGLTPAQADAASRDGAVLVLAGAGTGKTKTLTAAVAWRIGALGIPAARILAVTFTNKAAQEMQGRIRAMLAGQAVPSWVGTFHGLGARQLRAEPEVAGLRHGFEILDADDSKRLVKRTMQALHAGGDEEDPGAEAAVQRCRHRLGVLDWVAAAAGGEVRGRGRRREGAHCVIC